MISIYINILKKFKNLYYIILINSYIIEKIENLNRILVLKIKKLINIKKFKKKKFLI